MVPGAKQEDLEDIRSYDWSNTLAKDFLQFCMIENIFVCCTVIPVYVCLFYCAIHTYIHTYTTLRQRETTSEKLQMTGHSYRPLPPATPSFTETNSVHGATPQIPSNNVLFHI